MLPKWTCLPGKSLIFNNNKKYYLCACMDAHPTAPAWGQRTTLESILSFSLFHGFQGSYSGHHVSLASAFLYSLSYPASPILFLYMLTLKKINLLMRETSYPPPISCFKYAFIYLKISSLTLNFRLEILSILIFMCMVFYRSVCLCKYHVYSESTEARRLFWTLWNWS